MFSFSLNFSQKQIKLYIYIYIYIYDEMNCVTMWEFEEWEENLQKKERRIIRRISFIDCINMESRIMVLVKVWYEWINLIKIVAPDIAAAHKIKFLNYGKRIDFWHLVL